MGATGRVYSSTLHCLPEWDVIYSDYADNLFNQRNIYIHELGQAKSVKVSTHFTFSIRFDIKQAPGLASVAIVSKKFCFFLVKMQGLLLYLRELLFGFNRKQHFFFSTDSIYQHAADKAMETTLSQRNTAWPTRLLYIVSKCKIKRQQAVDNYDIFTLHFEIIYELNMIRQRALLRVHWPKWIWRNGNKTVYDSPFFFATISQLYDDIPMRAIMLYKRSCLPTFIPSEQILLVTIWADSIMEYFCGKNYSKRNEYQPQGLSFQRNSFLFQKTMI